MSEKAKTEHLGTNLDQIPFEGLEAVGKIFAEGAIKYGRDNWKKGTGDKEYQLERLNHAIRHLMLYANDDRSEAHLAKVAWFCLTQIWHEAQQTKPTPEIKWEVTTAYMDSKKDPEMGLIDNANDIRILIPNLSSDDICGLMEEGVCKYKKDKNIIYLQNKDGDIIRAYATVYTKAPITRPAQAEPIAPVSRPAETE